MIETVFKCFFPFWESLFRRLFGSDGFQIPVIKYRVVQHILNILMMGYLLFVMQYHWAQIIVAVSIVEFWFWSKGHGAFFDFGTGTADTEAYDDYWYYPYELPAIVISVILLNPYFLLAGFCVSATWTGYKKGLTTVPTEVAEWGVGFIIGLLLVL